MGLTTKCFARSQAQVIALGDDTEWAVDSKTLEAVDLTEEGWKGGSAGNLLALQV